MDLLKQILLSAALESGLISQSEYRPGISINNIPLSGLQWKTSLWWSYMCSHLSKEIIEIINRIGWLDMNRTVGRPQRYAPVLLTLVDDELYTPSGIAVEASLNNTLYLYIEGNADDDLNLLKKETKQRIRINMGFQSRAHAFPDQGDGMVSLPGMPPTPAWYGSRWKAIINIML